MSETHQGSAPEKHDVKIFVNTVEKTVPKGKISFQTLVNLAYDGNPPTGPNWVFEVAYRRGQASKPQGTLTAGEEVEVVENMSFTDTGSDKS